MKTPEWVASNLKKKSAEGNYRELKSYSFNLSNNFSSNDYLGLSIDPQVLADYRLEPSVGSCASRLMGADSGESIQLEKDLSEYFNFEDVLLFSSGFLANLGLLSTLVRKQDVVFSDKYIHSSLIEGIKLSNAKHFRFRHNDLEHLDSFLQRESLKREIEQCFYIVVESLYSMQGDSPDLSELSELARKYNCFLIVDESHAVGVFANGISSNITRENLIVTATFSKAFGTYGGFVCGPSWLKDLLVNNSRELIYNTALPRALRRATKRSLQIIKNQPELGAELLRKAKKFGEQLSLNNYSNSQIIPLHVNSSEQAVRIADEFKSLGYLVTAIRPPTVPQPIIRISITLHHSEQILSDFLCLIKDRL